MIRTRVMGIVFVLASSLAACNQSPAEADATAKEAQRRADETRAEALHQAEEKAAKAQATADVEARRAEQTYVKARADFRAGFQRELDDLSVKIDALSDKAAHATGRHRTELNASLKEIEERRASLRSDLVVLDSTTAENFEAVKAALSKKMDDLKKTIQEAGSRV